MTMSLRFLFCGIFLFCLACSSELQSHKKLAKEHHLAKEHQLAIDQYLLHIEKRLAVEKRPDWENPYIYLLDIGDIYLELDDIESATYYYELAEEKDVKPAYVNDRYRYLASWHEDRGELEEAISVLEKYKDRDPELFNLVLDRLAKELVQQEEIN